MMNKSLAILALGVSAAFSAPAMATGNNCLDSNMMTCITETEINFFGGPGIEYEIKNNTQERLFGFGVSNTPEYRYASAATFTTGWSGRVFDADSWDSGENYFDFRDASAGQRSDPYKIWITGSGPQKLIEEAPIGKQLVLDEPVETVYLGSFAELFGTEDTHVVFFWNEYEQTNALNSGVELNNFFLNQNPNSDFSTFGAQGNVVTTSVTAVPEPETYAMFLAGLGLLGFARRNKQA